MPNELPSLSRKFSVSGKTRTYARRKGERGPSLAGVIDALERRQAGSGLMSVFVWTVGGVVLAACSGGTRIVEGDGVGGGASAVPVTRGVFDGAVSGARIYVDVNGNGEIDEGDAGPYVTDGSGFADIPWAYRGYSIIADVSGATDVETGEVLSGQFRSLVPSDPGGVLIATPLTDLLAGAEDKQGILDTIFGAGVVTVKEVEDPDYYRLVVPGKSLAAPTAPTAPGEGATAEALARYEAEQARYEAEQAAYVSQQITRASIALTELKADAAAAGGADISTLSALAEVVRDALYDPDPNTLTELRGRIEAREDEAGLIAGGSPFHEVYGMAGTGGFPQCGSSGREIHHQCAGQ